MPRETYTAMVRRQMAERGVVPMAQRGRGEFRFRYSVTPADVDAMSRTAAAAVAFVDTLRMVGRGIADMAKSQAAMNRAMTEMQTAKAAIERMITDPPGT